MGMALSQRSSAGALAYFVTIARGGAKRLEITVWNNSLNLQVAAIEWYDGAGTLRILEAVNVNAQSAYNRILGEGGTLPFPDTVRFSLNNPNPGADWHYHWSLYE